MSTQDDIRQSVFASRGRILQLAIEMETMMDTYISEYLSSDKDKQNEIVIVVLSKVMLSRKKSIFEFIILDRSGENKEASEQLVKDIDYAIEERNTFAHWPIDFSERAIELYEKEGKISYFKLKPGKHDKKTVLGFERPYEEHNINQLIGLLTSINKRLMKLIKV